MEDANNEIITVPAEKPPGILGDGALRPGKGNLALVRRAIRNRWPVPKELRESLIAQCQAVMEQSYKPADIIAAAKTILEADKINVAATKLDEQHHGQTNIQVNVDSQAAAGVKIYLPDNGRG